MRSNPMHPNPITASHSIGLVPALLALGLAQVAISAQAHLLASDSIACGGTTQVGQAGGIGWSGAWIADTGQNAVFVPAANSLANPSALATLGGSLSYVGTGLNSNGARIYRPLDVASGSAANLLGLTESHTTFFGDQQFG